MAWFTRNKPSVSGEPGGRTVRTEGLWQKCPGCSQILWRKTLGENLSVCPKCGHYFRIDAAARLELLLDAGWEEHEIGRAHV